MKDPRLRPAFILIGLTFLIRLWAAVKYPLSYDETYYWEWSRNLDWGYYDQGPLIGWWIRATCLVFGDTVLGVRAGILLAGSLTQVFLALLCRDLFPKASPAIAIAPAAITPLAFAGGFLATYDPLVVLFTAMAAYFAYHALFSKSSEHLRIGEPLLATGALSQQSPLSHTVGEEPGVRVSSNAAWVGLGVAYGLGLLAKHTMAIFAPCLLLFLIGSKEHRAWLKKTQPYLALLLGFAIYAPNLWWQSRHHWMTFEHLFVLAGKGVDHTPIRRLGEFIGSQAGILTPFLFLGLVAAVIWAWKQWRREGDDRAGFAWCLAAPALVLFTLLCIKSKVQANWAITGWLTPGLLYAEWLAQSDATQKRIKFMKAAFGLAAISTILVAVQELRAPIQWHIAAIDHQMNKLYGGKEMAQAVIDSRRTMEQETGKPISIGSVTYDYASRAAFYLPGQPRTFCLFLGTRPNSYLLWRSAYSLEPGESAVMIDDRPPTDPERVPYEKVFDRVELPETQIDVFRHPLYTGPIHQYYLYRCYGYHPVPELETPETR